eukprot:4691407-Alexandrium_andersonii.AAC.1
MTSDANRLTAHGKGAGGATAVQGIAVGGGRDADGPRRKSRWPAGGEPGCNCSEVAPPSASTPDTAHGESGR